MRKPLSPPSIFKERRKKLALALKDHEVLMVPSAPEHYRQPDVPYPYRQNSFFYYLTGFEEPRSFLVLRKKEPFDILFVQEKDPSREIWDGLRFGPEKAKEIFSMGEALKISRFDEDIFSLIQGASRIYLTRTVNKEWNLRLDRLFAGSKYEFKDGENLISQMRQIKSPHEIEKIKKACKASSKAHIEVMKACRPGISERKLHGVFINSIMSQNCERESYPGIFAGGKNALILHYMQNNNVCEDGGLLLVDAGAEWEYYASDITRTFPINGRFSQPQKILYDHVLRVQEEIIKSLRPGVSMKSIQDKTCRLLFDCLKAEGILSKKSQFEDLRKFFPHNFGHPMGLDVHDVSPFKKGEGVFEAGMVVTVEPGLYIPEDDQEASERFRGLGLRIEDDILITEDGAENLSSSLPKAAQEIENLMAS